MSESQWDESAIEAAKTIRSIADDIASEQGCKYTISQQSIQGAIAKHFADLRATYDLILELAILMSNAENGKRVDELLVNPLVQAAIERSK